MTSIACSFNKKLFDKLQTTFLNHNDDKNFCYFKEHLLNGIFTYENELFFVDESGLLNYLQKLHNKRISFFNGMILISQIIEELLDLERKIDSESKRQVSAPLFHSTRKDLDIPDFSLGPRHMGPSPKLSPLMNSGAAKKYKDIFCFWQRVCETCLLDERFCTDNSFSLSTLMLYFDKDVNFEKKLEMFRNICPESVLKAIIGRKYYEPNAKKKETIDLIFNELSFIS